MTNFQSFSNKLAGSVFKYWLPQAFLTVDGDITTFHALLTRGQAVYVAEAGEFQSEAGEKVLYTTNKTPAGNTAIYFSIFRKK